MEKKGISVVINTYNAEKFLQRILDPIKGFNEIVTYGIKSTDHAAKVTQRAGYKAVTSPESNHACVEPAQNFTLQSAKDPQLLVTDTNELMASELRIYLYQHINKPNYVKGFHIPRRDRFINTPKKGSSKDYQLRFLIREGAPRFPLMYTTPQVQGKVEYIDNHLYNVKLLHPAEDYLANTLEKCNRYTTNEVPEKKRKNYGVGTLLFCPFQRLSKPYFMNGETGNGITDFIDSIMTDFYQLMIVVRIIESKIKKQTEDEWK